MKGSKRYGRRSTPEFIDTISDFSEVKNANPVEQQQQQQQEEEEEVEEAEAEPEEEEEEEQGEEQEEEEEEEEDNYDSAIPRKREVNS